MKIFQYYQLADDTIYGYFPLSTEKFYTSHQGSKGKW